MDDKIEVLDARCVVCKNNLERRTWWAYHGDPMNMIIGPGSENQMSKDSELSCPRCGLLYAHPPMKG